MYNAATTSDHTVIIHFNLLIQYIGYIKLNDKVELKKDVQC